VNGQFHVLIPAFTNNQRLSEKISVTVEFNKQPIQMKSFSPLKSLLSKIHKIYYMQLLIRLKYSLNLKYFTSRLKECVFKCHLNAVVHKTFPFNTSVSLHVKLLNVLMPAYYVIVWKDEHLATGQAWWHLSHVYS